MKLEYFRYFEVICETKSFTKTAEKLYLSQPVISNAIKNLESYFCTRLIERKKFNNELIITENGYKFLDLAKKINIYENDLKGKLAKKVREDYIKLGIANFFEHAELEKILEVLITNIGSFNNESIIEEEVSELHNKLLSEEVDICITYYFNKKAISKSIVRKKLKDSNFKMFVNKSKILKKEEKNEFSFKNLNDEIILCLKKPREYSNILNQILKKYKVTPKKIIYIENLKTIEMMIENNRGISFLDEYSIQNEKICSLNTNCDYKFEIFLEAKSNNKDLFDKFLEKLNILED